MKPLSIGPPRNVRLRRLIGFFIRYKEPVRHGEEERKEGKVEEEEEERKEGKVEEEEHGGIGLVELSTQNPSILVVNSVHESEV